MSSNRLQKPTKVLFLDVDGVLNSIDYMKSERYQKQGVVGMDRKAVHILKSIVHKTGCKIVVSSTWRIGGIDKESHFHEELKRTDLSDVILNSVIDKTPQGGYHIDILGRNYVRGNEIQLWMDNNDFDGKFAILDDDSDMAHLMEYLVKTDINVGITEADADRVIKILTD